jgi:hypothetical protein
MNNKCIVRNTTRIANPNQNYLKSNYLIRCLLRIVKISKISKGIRLTIKNIAVSCNPTKKGTVKNKHC